MLSKGNIYKGNSVREKIPLEKHREREFKNTERKKNKVERKRQKKDWKWEKKNDRNKELENW